MSIPNWFFLPVTAADDEPPQAIKVTLSLAKASTGSGTFLLWREE